jgi:hypothetical protein
VKGPAVPARAPIKPFVSLAPRYQGEFLAAKRLRMGSAAFAAEQAEDIRVAKLRAQCKPMRANSSPLVESVIA